MVVLVSKELGVFGGKPPKSPRYCGILGISIIISVCIFFSERQFLSNHSSRFKAFVNTILAFLLRKKSYSNNIIS